MALQQMSLFSVEERERQETTSTFASNLSLPIHRWFRYSAGFSAAWVQTVLAHNARHGDAHILDPFAGSGTVVIESAKSGFAAIGLEAHPFVARIARVKNLWRTDATAFYAYASDVLRRAQTQIGDESRYPSLIQRCFPPEILRRLDTLKQAWLQSADGSPCAELTWLALVAILRECSPVGTAQWQYVLPKKTKVTVNDPYAAFLAKIQMFRQDMLAMQRFAAQPIARVVEDDARSCASVPDQWADLVITSPPYANNFDYADATRLEMSFFGEIDGWSALQRVVRQHLLPSCTQHIASEVAHTQVIIDDPLLYPIHEALATVCEALAQERLQHGGKKPYHTMIAAYFQGMAQVWHALRRVTKDGGLVCFVIGDSAPYGIHVPVEQWLGELALAAGFASYTFAKTRDRNIKWKNRKHTVPLQEGHLWVQG